MFGIATKSTLGGPLVKRTTILLTRERTRESVAADVLALAGTPRHGTFDIPFAEGGERERELFSSLSLSPLIEPGPVRFGGVFYESQYSSLLKRK